jgi:hypothetical protein
MTKLFVSGTEGRAYQEFRGRDLNKGQKLSEGGAGRERRLIGRKRRFDCRLVRTIFIFCCPSSIFTRHWRVGWSQDN